MVWACVRFLFGMMGSRIAQGVPLALSDTERPAALRTAVHEIERRWGLHAAGRLFGVSPREAGFSTGIGALDEATGFDGIPRGRLSELTGAPGSGALTLGWRVLGAALEGGGLAAYVDLPGTFAPTAERGDGPGFVAAGGGAAAGRGDGVAGECDVAAQPCLRGGVAGP